MPISGRRDTKAIIKRPVFTTNALGERSATFEEVSTEWVELRWLRGKEAEQAQQITSEVEAKITCLYHAALESLAPEYQVLIGTDIFDVLEALPIPGGRPVKVEILAKKRNLNG